MSPPAPVAEAPGLDTAPGSSADGSATLSRGLVLLIAVAGGAAVSNLYYVQPLLATIGRAFDVHGGTTGLLVTASQLGYAAGLILIVPLGDVVNRRRLVAATMSLSIVALVACALAPSLIVLGLCLLGVGLTTVAAQILVPFAHDLAAPGDRGRVVGVVVSGLITGMLTARAISGVIGDLAGWRAAFVLAASIMLVLMVGVLRALPSVPPNASVPYLELVGSVISLIRTEPVLRLRLVFGALGLAVFSVFWTAVTFLLSAPPFNYPPSLIGLVALTGVVGALAAQGSGRLHDRGWGIPALGTFWAVAVVGWGVCALGSRSIAPILVGVILVDICIQGQHLLNQSVILALRPEVRSRVNTAYVCTAFLSAAVAAAAASAAWDAGGWSAVCALGAGLSALAFGVWTIGVLRGWDWGATTPQG